MILFSPLTNLLYLVDNRTGKKKEAINTKVLNTYEVLNSVFDMMSLKHKVRKVELNIYFNDSGDIEVTQYTGGDFKLLEIIK
jgi:uncharacterized membrane protein YsdA (DUF1294 family)